MASYRDRLPVVGGGGAVIKSVQRGSATIGSGGDSISVTISEVVRSRSIVHISFTASSGISTDSPQSAVCSVRLNSPTSLFLYRTTSTTQQIMVSWQVIEYVSGVSVQRGRISDSGKVFSATIASIDTSKSYSIHTSSPGGSSASAIQAQVYGGVSSSTGLAFSRHTDFGPILIDWQVVSYV